MALLDFSLPYQSRLRSAAFSRDATLAQNAYSTFLSQQRGTRDLAEIDRRNTAGLDRFGSSFARRGLGTSGVFKQAQNDYAQGWMQQKQDLYDQLAAIANQNKLADQQVWSGYYQTAADLEAQKQAQILATAAQLNDFKQYLGG